jgi:PPOX class probable FMN-dependent enzyme
MSELSSLEALRTLYVAPTERAQRKQLSQLDKHCRDFIAMSPFVVLSTCDERYHLDASPRGGDPGFVKITADGGLLLPDAPGNNRLDSLENIVRTGQVGLLFMIPGFDETLRVNGHAVLSTRSDDIRCCTTERRAPKLVIRVSVTAAYLHCAKAFLRSKLWQLQAQVDRATLPTMGQMIGDQTGLSVAPETREEMERRVAPDL